MATSSYTSDLPPCSSLRRDISATRISNPYSISEVGFFPRSRIQLVCTEQRVREVLQCFCKPCHDHRQQLGIRNPLHPLKRIAGSASSKYANRLAVLLFALLLYMDTPWLIHEFLAQDIDDDCLKTKYDLLTPEYLRRNFPFLSMGASEHISHTIPRFFVPCLEDHAYCEYPASTVLPFHNEQKLGKPDESGTVMSEGSFGTVFSFEILDEYRKLPEFRDVRVFARKELYPPVSHGRFQSEYQNLLKVKELQDKHLVQVVKAYKHGSRYNFVFPCAKTNMARYLREQHYRAFEGHWPTVSHPIWAQFLGIARGLNRVLDFSNGGGTVHFGYHLDLKPENILVSEAGIFIITDFGQATFKSASDDASSIVAAMGGSEAYGPPEVDEKDIRQNRKYDIWSLGCILLEICAFVTRGTIGVLGLDLVRLTKAADSNHEDDRFFSRKLNSSSYELKKEVCEWMEILPYEVEQGKNQDFLREILALCLRMLDVCAATRASSKDTCVTLDWIISRYKCLENYAPTIANLVMRPTPNGLPFGSDLVGGMQNMNYNLQGYWQSGPFCFSQHSDTLCIQVLKGSIWEETIFGSRCQLRIVHRYAHRPQEAWKTGFFSDTSIYLSYCNSATGPSRNFVRFSLDQSKQVLFLQELLSSHAVFEARTWKASKLRACFRTRKSSMYLSYLKRKANSTASPSSLTLDANSVQIWVDSTYDDVKRMATLSPPLRVSAPRPLCLGPSLRRIVIFGSTTIAIIRLAKNVRIKKESRPNSDSDGRRIQLVPTDAKEDPSFKISVFQTGPDGAASVPLTRSRFELEEEENSTECTSLSVDFLARKDAQAFQRAYKRAKKAWKEETKSLARMKSRIGEEFGWSQF